MAIVGDCYDYFDKRFYGLTIPIAEVEELFSGCRWAEGPVWFEDMGQLVWSDIPNNRLLRYVPEHGVSVFRKPSNFINGNTRDRSGRLVSCSHGARAVLRTEPDGTLTTLADRFAGKRLNSPNDVVVDADGAIWFTDPDYGILSDYEGFKADPEQDRCAVYRIDPQSAQVTRVCDSFARPNGLAFSPDEKTLYIAESGRSHDPGIAPVIRSFAVDGARLSGEREFYTLPEGLPDGFRLDTEGNVWTSAGAGVDCVSPEGERLGRIRLPQTCANLSFGGARRNILFMTATKSLYSVYVGASGLQRP